MSSRRRRAVDAVAVAESGDSHGPSQSLRRDPWRNEEEGGSGWSPLAGSQLKAGKKEEIKTINKLV